MKITGTILSGVGKGAFFTQVDWVVKQCEAMLGYRPYPGTLNVRVRSEDLEKLEEFLSAADCMLVPDDPAFCAARVKKITLNEIPAAIVLPSEDVRVHENRVVEVIASLGLKKALGIDDGDEVTISGWKGQEQGMTTIYRDIYEFAASAGAFEGYVFQREKLEAAGLDNWVGNLLKQYRGLPPEVRQAFQPSLDRTLGRAVRSLAKVFGETHPHVTSLRSLVAGKMPQAPDDFAEEKVEKADKYGQ